jgi:O-antigen/teichoic acid export membrane protein
MDLNPNAKNLERFVRDRLAANSLMGAIRFVAVSAVYLFMYPFLLKSLGPLRFGLWALLCIPSQYAAIGDLGLSNALIKMVAEAPPEKNTTDLHRLLGSATLTFLVLGAVLTAAVGLNQQRILAWLHISSELLSDARILLLGAAALIWIILLENVYIALLSGLHRMDLAHAIQIESALLSALGIFVAIRLQTGLIGLMLSNVLTASVVWATAVLVCRRVARIRWTWVPLVGWNAERSLLRFGLYLYVAALSSLLLDPSIKMLLTRYGSLALVSYFELASRIVIQIRAFFQNILLPLLPASSLFSNEMRALRSLFGRSIRLLCLGAIPIYLAMITLAPSIVHLWLGKELPLVQNAMPILAFGWLLNILTIPAYLFIQGMNFPRAAMWCSLIQGLICIGGSYFLIPKLGLYGAAFCEALGLTVAAAYVFARFLRICPMDFREIFGNSAARALGIPVAFAAALYLLGNVSRIQSSWTLAILVVSSFALYGSFLYRKSTNGFTAADLVKEYLPVRGMGRGIFSASNPEAMSEEEIL